MRYHAIIRGQERLIEVSAHGTRRKVVIHPAAGTKGEPRVLDLDAVQLRGPAVSILADGKSWSCDLEPGKEGKFNVRLAGQLHSLELLDERRLRLRRSTGKFSLEGPQRVDAPMPGKVVRVMVKVGDEVKEGQGLVVIEAMKMENELKSPKAGKVTELNAVEGAAVESGAKLVVVT